MKKKSNPHGKKKYWIAIIKWLFYLYIAIAALLGTGYMTLWGFVTYARYTRIVTLPNGYILAPTKFNRSNIQILDENGDTVVTSVSSVMWCNDVVYGKRYKVLNKHYVINENPNREGHIRASYSFIYDRRTHSLYQYQTNVSYSHDFRRQHGIFSSDEEGKFEEKLKELGMPAFNYKKTVRYLDVVNGLDSFAKDEKCRTGFSRKDGSISLH